MEEQMTKDLYGDVLEMGKHAPVDLKNGELELTIKNGLPVDWNAVITVIGAAFGYLDNSTSQDGPKTVNLRSGESAALHSKGGQACCQHWYSVVSVNIPGVGQQTVQDKDDVPQNQCMRYETITIAPARGATKQEPKVVAFTSNRSYWSS